MPLVARLDLTSARSTVLNLRRQNVHFLYRWAPRVFSTVLELLPHPGHLMSSFIVGLPWLKSSPVQSNALYKGDWTLDYASNWTVLD